MSDNHIELKPEEELRALEDILKRSKTAYIERRINKQVLQKMNVFQKDQRVDMEIAKTSSEIDFIVRKVGHIRERIVEVMDKAEKESKQ